MTVSMKTAGKTAKNFGRVFALAPLFLLFFVAAPVFSQAPKLGQPTDLQKTLNLMPAVPVSGQTLKFDFGGDIWIAKLNGKNLLAGTLVTTETKDGSVMVLTQTHTYVGVAWVKTPGADIILDYIPGPPAVLRPITRAEADEKLAAAAAAAAK